MPNYLRARIPGGTYFFTLASRRREPCLADDGTRKALRDAIATTRQRWPFEINAWVLLPDHLHCLWTLPEEDADFSKRWSTIKRLTTQSLGRSVWQLRFWEHFIRNEQDYAAHLDYIHWNPVKHGLAARPADWPYSTFHRYLQQGVYQADWCDTRTHMNLG